MRRRRFVPESPGVLESRALLSGAGHPAASAPLDGAYFNTLLLQTKGYFEQFALDGHNAKLLKSQLQAGLSTLPYNRIDQLIPKANAMVDQMAANVAAGVPGAITMGYQTAVASLKADINMRIQDGTIHVYHKHG